MININDLKDLAYEDEGDFENELLTLSPEDEAQELINYYEQRYGFNKIAG